MKELETFLRRNKKYKIRVAVVGDTMIDEYYSVKADRVSPEFPIPVMQMHRGIPTFSCPGGAGNVCSQFKHFNVDVRHFAFADSETQRVLEESGISTKYCVDMLYWANKAPRKKRFYHGDFPLCRLDIEARDYDLDPYKLRLCQEELFSTYDQTEKDITILSDYGKGVFSDKGHDTKLWVQSDDVPTIVDPKGGPLSRWKGCTVIKPNEKEAISLSGEQDWRKQCIYFMRETECTAVVITQEGLGVVGNVLGREFEYRPKEIVKANSVVGAGDCFVAFLAMGLAHAIDIVDVVEIAFEAGARYVQRKHNQPVEIEELLDTIQRKLVDPEDLENRNYTLAATNGVFDLFHRGHLSTLEFAKSKADKLVVLVNSDESVKKIKGENRPIIPQKPRMELIAGLECVDYVVSFNETTPYQTLRKIQPDCLIKGGDYTIQQVNSAEIVGEENVHIAPFVEGLSSSDIIDKIKRT